MAPRTKFLTLPGRLGGKFGIGADAPRLAPGKVDLVRAQKPPHMLDMNVAERFGDQRPGPVGAACRRRLIELRQNASASLLAVFGLSPAIAGLGEAGQAILGVAHPPLRRGSSGAAERPANRPRRRALRRHQHDPRLQPRAVLGLARARQTLKLGALLGRQSDRCRFKAAHATLKSRLTHER